MSIAFQFPTASETQMFARHPAPWRVTNPHALTEGIVVELLDGQGMFICLIEQFLGEGLVALSRRAFLEAQALGADEPQSDDLVPTPLEAFLAVNPLPWRKETDIPGPPGSAQVAIVDADGDEVEVTDDENHADALIQAFTLAAAVLGRMTQ